MRVTLTTLNRHMQTTINGRFNDLGQLQEQLSTGRRLQRPSDDPVDVANDLKLRSKVVQMSQFNTNIKDGMALMSVTDTSMTSMNVLMQRTRELAIEASNDTLTTNERLYIQKEVEQLTRQVVSLANTNYKGDYVFAGAQTKIKPFPIMQSQGQTAQNYANGEMAYFDAGGQFRDGFRGTPINNIIPGTLKMSNAGVDFVEGVDYTMDYVNGVMTPINPALAFDMTPPNASYAQGQFQIEFDYIGSGTDIYGQQVTNRDPIYREIETGVTMPVNISGDEMIIDPATKTNLFETLISLNQALIQNDQTAIGQSIDNIDIGFKTMLSAQARNGARVNRFELTLDRNEQQSAETTRLQSELEDADFADTVSRFNLLETVYNAALKSGAKILQPSLANFL